MGLSCLEDQAGDCEEANNENQRFYDGSCFAAPDCVVVLWR